MLRFLGSSSGAPSQSIEDDRTPRAEQSNPFNFIRSRQPSSASIATQANPPQTPRTPGPAMATTQVTTQEPNFDFKMDPQALAAKRKDPNTGFAPKGRLSLKLVAARHLAAPSPASLPYVCVTFDGNEFVSREPIHEEGEDATGVAAPKANGNTPRRPSPPPKTSPPSPTDKGKASASALGQALENHSRANPPSLAPLNTGPFTAQDPIQDATTPTGAGPPMLSPTAGISAYNPTWKHEVLFDVVNEKSVIECQIFERTVEEEMFLGLVEIRPRLVNGHTVDQWFPLVARSEDETVTGEIRIQIRYERFDSKSSLGVNDFDFLRMIGRGTFGRVFQVRKKDTKRIYAMKVLSKQEIVAKKEIAHTIGERKILQRSSNCPFLLGLKFSFQTERDLFLVLDFKSGGELFHHLQKEGRFTEDRARFYTAEIVLAFEHLHKFDIVYRDLKPENILLDSTGHIVLCDFGLSKPDLPKDALTNTFCGTTEYLAPEVLLDDHGYSKLVDFWSLGVLLFEMCCGWSPFYAEDVQQMYKLICFGKVKFPRGVIGEDGKQFVKGLLSRNPRHRLGATRDTDELKEHPFFSSIDWEALGQKQVVPPFKPAVDSDESVANFDPEFTEANVLEEAPDDVNFDEDDPSDDWLNKASLSRQSSQKREGGVAIRPPRRPPAQPHQELSESVQAEFRGFTFSGESLLGSQRHESMVSQTNKLFAMTTMNDPEPMDATMSTTNGNGNGTNGTAASSADDEWEDQPDVPVQSNSRTRSDASMR